MAAEHISPKARDGFFERRKAWGGSVRVADYDLTGLKIIGEDDAESYVKIAWYRANEGDLRVTTVKQKWHSDAKGDWKLTEEQRVDGDVGLLGEPPVAPTAAAVAAPRRSQFPTIYLGGGRRPKPLSASPSPRPASLQRRPRASRRFRRHSARTPPWAGRASSSGGRRPQVAAGEGFGGADFFAAVFLAAVFFGAFTARRRLRRAFFFAWPLRRVIFCDLRRSNLPMGRADNDTSAASSSTRALPSPARPPRTPLGLAC